MSAGKVRGMLGAVLVATLLAAYFAPPPAEDGVTLSEHSRTATSHTAPAGGGIASPARSAAATQSVKLLSIHPRESEDEEDRDRATSGFTSTQWTPPVKVNAPVAAPAPSPPPPRAPPLPFQVLGRYVEGDQVVVFLKHNDQNLVVRVGDTIAENYRVESLKGSTLRLLYTPLNQQQTLEIGGEN